MRFGGCVRLRLTISGLQGDSTAKSSEGSPELLLCKDAQRTEIIRPCRCFLQTNNEERFDLGLGIGMPRTTRISILNLCIGFEFSISGVRASPKSPSYR